MRARISALVAVAALVSACLPVIDVKTRTRIAADGTTSRDTVLTKTRRDGNSDDEKLWNARAISADLPAALGDGFRAVNRGDSEIRLGGVFAHPSQVPQDFLRDVPVLDKQAHNQIEFVTEDLVFATRFIYRERYVDAILPEDLKESKRDAVRFMQKFAHAMIAGEFGRSFDTAELDHFVDDALADLTGDLIEIYWSERKQLSKLDPVTQKTGLDRGLARALKRIERIGVSFDADQGTDDNLAQLEAWLRELFANNLKRKVDGSRPTAGDFDYFFPHDAAQTGITTMIARAAEREYGTTDKAEEVAKRVLLGVTGTFGSPPAEAEFRFDCAVEMPGSLLRTNGFLETERSAFWVFEGNDLFPQGQLLEAESFEPDPELLGKIRELKSDVDRRTAARLVGALQEVDAAQRARVRELLAIAARQGTITAIPAAAEGDGAGQADRNHLAALVAIMTRDP